MSNEDSIGISAEIIVPVKGAFSELEPGFAAREAFTKELESTGLAEWCFSEGGMYEWTIGFIRIKNVPRFESEVVERIKQYPATGPIRLIVRDGEEPKGKRR
jgi:hypothetical protein